MSILLTKLYKKSAFWGGKNSKMHIKGTNFREACSLNRIFVTAFNYAEGCGRTANGGEFEISETICTGNVILLFHTA